MRMEAASGWSGERAGAWRAAGALAALGALTMVVGLMLGPTPGTDPEAALRRIDDTRAMYVVTNGVDLAGLALLFAGLFAVAALTAAVAGRSVVAAVAGAATVIGTALIGVVLAIQTVVDPGIARRLVEAAAGDAATQLALGRAFLDLETGLFGIGIMVEMAGIAGIGAALARAGAADRAPAVDRRVLWAGVAVAAAAGLTGIGFFVDALGWLERLEAICSLATLVWVVVTGALLYRAAGVPEAPGLDLSRSLRVR